MSAYEELSMSTLVWATVAAVADLARVAVEAPESPEYHDRSRELHDFMMAALAKARGES